MVEIVSPTHRSSVLVSQPPGGPSTVFGIDASGGAGTKPMQRRTSVLVSQQPGGPSTVAWSPISNGGAEGGAAYRSSVVVAQQPGGNSSSEWSLTGLGGASASARALLRTPVRAAPLVLSVLAPRDAAEKQLAYAALAPAVFGTRAILIDELTAVFSSFDAAGDAGRSVRGAGGGAYEGEGEGDADVVLPLSVAIEMCIVAPLQQQRAAVDAAQTTLILRKFRFRDHLAALRLFMLGAAGLFAECVAGELFGDGGGRVRRLGALATREALKTAELERVPFAERFSYGAPGAAREDGALGEIAPQYELKVSFLLPLHFTRILLTI